ncbi:MAG: hypothetical protein PHZ19_01800 [Candidatus Thermoplasmatota archaeon]|nr:hypothetical protein [Candidatus Thermoplasmatota archaeon]
MRVTDDTLVTGGWCSFADCLNVLADIERAVASDPDILTKAILQSTGRAQAILRARWPHNWPWGGAVPQEIRDAVAVLATCRAVRHRVFSGGQVEILELLRPDCKDAEKFLQDLANGAAHLELDVPAGKGLAATSAAPRGELGFRGD